MEVLTRDHDWMLDIPAADSDLDDRLLPAAAPQLDVLELIPWESFVPQLQASYCRGLPGRQQVRQIVGWTHNLDDT